MTMVETINSIGNWFCDNSLRMLIQSSVLIVALFATDLLIRKRVRAVVRYCMWMLVLVKLVLPTTLSVPTGAGYWFGMEHSQPKTQTAQVAPVTPVDTTPQLSNSAMPAEVVNTPLVTQVQSMPADKAVTAIENKETVMPVVATLPPAPQPVSVKGWLFLGWAVGVLILTVLLIQRYWFVKSLIAQSRPAAEPAVLSLLESARHTVGLNRSVELRLTANMLSPAACGLNKPVVLMPAELVATLSDEKLHAVLLHELCHIKRGDLWVNLAQTILQIVNFFNPLLWVANAIIRGIREKAVDEMVLTKLGSESKSYCTTLIDIAEIAFTRPHLSLRLIGVVESKTALQDRIKHIISRPFPKSARLSWISITGVVILAAVLLPMAKGVDLPKSNIGINLMKEDRGKEYASGSVIMEQYYNALQADDQTALTTLTANADTESQALRLTFNDKEALKRNIEYEINYLKRKFFGYIPNTISDDAGLIARYGIYSICSGTPDIMRLDCCKYELLTAIIPDQNGQWQINSSKWVRRDKQLEFVSSLRQEKNTDILLQYLQKQTGYQVSREVIVNFLSELDNKIQKQIGNDTRPDNYPGTLPYKTPDTKGSIPTLGNYIDILKSGYDKGDHYSYYDFLFDKLVATCDFSNASPGQIYTNEYFAIIIPNNVTRKDGQPYIPALFFIARNNKNSWLLSDYCWLGENDIQTFIDGFSKNFPDVVKVDINTGKAQNYTTQTDNYSDHISDLAGSTWELTDISGDRADAYRSAKIYVESENMVRLEAEMTNGPATIYGSYNIDNNIISITNTDTGFVMSGAINGDTMNLSSANGDLHTTMKKVQDWPTY
ncbi:MAG: M56 family metallopeptidase, partial [Sedimentisphaerales bacterium]|nr:M56 family metallopeptidase [Sedimentisphaerales bacterium]